MLRRTLTLLTYRYRAAAVAFALVILGFALETAVHSVHHPNPADAAACPAAAVASQIAGTAVELPALDAPGLDVHACVVSIAPASPAARSWGPERGRAPPSAVA